MPPTSTPCTIGSSRTFRKASKRFVWYFLVSCTPTLSILRMLNTFSRPTSPTFRRLRFYFSCNIYLGDIDEHRTTIFEIFQHHVAPPCCFVNCDVAVQGEVYQKNMESLLGHGIFNSDGEVWRQQRKTASLEFANRILREYSTVAFRENSIMLAEILARACQSHEAIEMQVCFQPTPNLI